MVVGLITPAAASEQAQLVQMVPNPMAARENYIQYLGSLYTLQPAVVVEDIAPMAGTVEQAEEAEELPGTGMWEPEEPEV